MPPKKRKKISNEHRKSKFLLSRRRLGFSCGEKRGKGLCKMSVYYNACNVCKVAFLSNIKCVRVDTPPPISKKTRLATGYIIDNPGSLADASPCSTLASNHALVTHAKKNSHLRDLSILLKHLGKAVVVKLQLLG